MTRFVYKEVVLEDLANGRIGALRAASLEQSAKGIGEKGAGGAVEARYTNFSAKGVDARQFAHVLAFGRESDKEEANTIEDEAAIESVSFTFPDAGIEIRTALGDGAWAARPRPRRAAASRAGRRRDAGARRHAGAGGARHDGAWRFRRARCRRDRTRRAGRKALAREVAPPDAR